MKLIDLILILFLAVVFAAAILMIRSNRKKGRSCLSCGGDCASCSRAVFDGKRQDGAGKETG